VDQIVHMPGFWPDYATLKGGSTAKYLITEDDARVAARRQIVVITTLGELLAMTDKMKDPAIAKKLVGVAKNNVELLRRHSVRIAIGSDQFRMDSAEEALQLMKHGLFDTRSMLTAWCSLTPRVIFPKRKVGELKDGYEANFIVLESDPMSTPEALVAPPVMVFKHGKQILNGTVAK
jgi:imidazolonepropionase-like amidohydrolase